MKTAEALEFKWNLSEFKSNTRVGKYYGVSREIVREFRALLTLPEHIRTSISQGKIGLDTGARLARVKKQIPEILDDLAEVVADLSALEARDVIEFALKNPDLSALQAKQYVLDAKTVYIDEYHVVVVLSKDEYTRLESEAKKRRLPSGKLVEMITKGGLREKEPMLRNEGPVRQEQDHYSLAVRPQVACQNEFDALREWLQQELISVTSTADILERAAVGENLSERIRSIGDRAREIDHKDLREITLGIENIFEYVKIGNIGAFYKFRLYSNGK